MSESRDRHVENPQNPPGLGLARLVKALSNSRFLGRTTLHPLTIAHRRVDRILASRHRRAIRKVHEIEETID